MTAVATTRDAASGSRWWQRRFGDPVPATVADALGDMFLAHKVRAITAGLKVKQGKYPEILDADLVTEQTAVRA